MLGKIDTRHLVRPSLNRRVFLKVIGLSGAGFMIGCSESSDTAPIADAGPAATPEPVTNTVMGPFVKIGSDNTVTVLVKHLDKGQGVTTGLPTIVAEELDADWSQMRAEFSPADDVAPDREPGARVREMLHEQGHDGRYEEDVDERVAELADQLEVRQWLGRRPVEQPDAHAGGEQHRQPAQGREFGAIVIRTETDFSIR